MYNFNESGKTHLQSVLFSTPKQTGFSLQALYIAQLSTQGLKTSLFPENSFRTQVD